MSKREKAPAVGEAPCPISGCAQRLQVFKYQERSGRGSIFKGKFYADCPAHGRVIDARSTAMQEHVLTQGKIWGPSQAEKPAVQPAQAVAAEPVKPAPSPAPKAAPEAPSAPAQPARRGLLSGWNLWDWWPVKGSARDS